MIISPPFLPPCNGVSEQEWLRLAMASPSDHSGSFPVGLNGTWHGGIHLEAPTVNGSALPVVAIADGTVVFVRNPTAINRDENHPLNYDAGRAVSGWTSDDCVVLEHNTEIGPAAAVRFFSVYVHLQTVDRQLERRKSIYRKEAIGTAGYIYGKPQRIHFEIICDDVNLCKLTGRASGQVLTEKNGREDALFGDVYFYVPAGTAVFTHRPGASDTLQKQAPNEFTSEDLIVSVRFDGHAFVTTLRPDRTVVRMLKYDDGEYELLRLLVHEKAPSRAAAYEKARFGRVISEAPAQSEISMWTRVGLTNGEKWIDLGSAKIASFSDADFPDWRGWRLLDATSSDCRVRSAQLLPGDRHENEFISDAEASSLISSDDSRKKISKYVCRLHSEWDLQGFYSRWAWLKDGDKGIKKSLKLSEFERLTRHVEALCFWDKAAPQMGSMTPTHWHFHPFEFISQFRRCGWLSVHELAQCLPRRCAEGTLPWARAIARAKEHQLSINRLLQKYCGESWTRHIHMLAQIYQETGILSLMSESGSGAGQAYGPFFGRGYMQLTWPSNYAEFGKFMSISNISGAYLDPRITQSSLHTWAPGDLVRAWFPRYDPSIVARSLNHAAESAGYFWVTKRFRGTRNINRACDLGVKPTVVAFISWLVNGGQNGHGGRQQYVAYLVNILLDEPLRTGSAIVRFPSLSPPRLCSHFPPVEVAHTQSVEVFYDRQVP